MGSHGVRHRGAGSKGRWRHARIHGVDENAQHGAAGAIGCGDQQGDQTGMTMTTTTTTAPPWGKPELTAKGKASLAEAEFQQEFPYLQAYGTSRRYGVGDIVIGHPFAKETRVGANIDDWRILYQRWHWPYGMWTLADGGEGLVNR